MIGELNSAAVFSATIDREARRAKVANDSDARLDGIDRIEVLSNQHILLVWLIYGPVPEGLGPNGVVILGGVRIDPAVNPVRVKWAYRADVLIRESPTGTAEDDRTLVRNAVESQDHERVLVVRTSSSGDWSTYVLKLLVPEPDADPRRSNSPTRRIDPPLAQVPFSFKVNCPSELDCRDTRSDVPAERPSPVLDYLARDYEALRVRLLDRLTALLPEWTDRSPADPMVTLVELFASVGDRLAVWQDAVAGEAYLSTARRRTSVSRHVRLLDYRLHEGCSARTWLVFNVTGGVKLPAGYAVCDVRPQGVAPGELPPVATALDAGAVVFETRHPATLTPARNRMSLYAWGDTEHYLPAGATAAFVVFGERGDPDLHAGDIVILAAIDPPTKSDPKKTPAMNGDVKLGDPSIRHVVRLISDPGRHFDPLDQRHVLELRWSSADALPFTLAVTRRGEKGDPESLAVALGNVVLADHGGTVHDDPLIPAMVPATGMYRPRLQRNPVAWIDSTDDFGLSASAVMVPDSRRALPALGLNDGQRSWDPRLDLLDSHGQAPHVVVESESDGVTVLRFGNGVSGRRPDPATTLRVSYRIGTGTAGNVAADVLTTRLAWMARGVGRSRTSSSGTFDGAGNIRSVINALPARGGVDPESHVEARELAPRAFRSQERAVTSADYAFVAMRHPAVQSAVARRRWTGSWYTQEVTIDVVADAGRDSVAREVTAALNRTAMAGVDVKVVTPVTVPLELVMRVHIAPGYLRSEVARSLADAFSSVRLPGGRVGFFHPDNFTFGQPLLVSDLVATAMAVSGVDWVEIGDDRDGDDRDAAGLRFRRLGEIPTEAALQSGHINAENREILRADSDPSRPENGRVGFLFRGGS